MSQTISEIPNGTKVLVDTNVLIYAVTGASLQCLELLLRCRANLIRGYITAVIVDELIHRLMVAEAIQEGLIRTPRQVRQLKRNVGALKSLSLYREQVEFVLSMGLEILPITEGTVRRALDLQARYGLLAGDSLSVASATENAVADVASNDEDLGRVEGLRLWRPADLPSP